ncbi:hypothetical protein ACG2LH_04425 [Zhouia sp. PK063]|uniref:hypothetical protein n=1 Tax=Zhouia sp. PK063 TaxID=3373602 RepID=UPI003788EAC8
MKYIYIFICLWTNVCLAQNKETVFLYFDANSKELCNIPQDQKGRYNKNSNLKRFVKIVQNDKNTIFYICKEQFINSQKDKRDTCKVNLLNTIKFSKIENLIEQVNKVNPLYPDKVFNNIYIIEKINDSFFVKYKVKWKYYIE